jgi:hypothetical protein
LNQKLLELLISQEIADIIISKNDKFRHGFSI